MKTAIQQDPFAGVKGVTQSINHVSVLCIATGCFEIATAPNLAYCVTHKENNHANS